MRRLLSILLFIAILLPLFAPLISADAVAQAGVPACCRRDGAHHCMGNMAVLASPATHSVRAPRMVCPYQQRTVAVSHHDLSVASAAPTAMQVVLHQPKALAQVECLRRISFDRGRQKRGPPALLS